MKKHKMVEYITYNKEANFCNVKLYVFYNHTRKIDKQANATFLIGTKTQLERHFPFCYKKDCEIIIKSII